MRENSGSIPRKALAIFWSALLLVSFAASPLSAGGLQPAASAAFDRYAELTQRQFQSQLSAAGPFLWVDSLPQSKRDAAYADLRAGKVVIEKIETLDNSKPIAVPGGMIHHWIGTVFIPGATLAQTLSLMQDYNHHAEYFSPDVVRSKILSHSGADYSVLLRFKNKKIITVVLDTDHAIHYQSINATRAASWSHTTRVQQVENYGSADEKLDPPGQDGGFLWRMNTYWKFEEKDGGTYVESQSVSLTRDIPVGLGWMIGSFVESVPRESLAFTLSAARSAVLSRVGPAK